ETAIRLALGAPSSAILQWAGLHATRLAGLGILFGSIGAWLVSGWLKTLVYGISAQNPVMMLAAGGAVIVLAALAAGIPIWRAIHTDAVRNLREA
ncbi:MAG: ABC transporter permease, partial [Candidatus Acidiferrum sp.]